MLLFPNAKINLGLNVIEKRPDGFHNIESVFYPVDWCDALEILENKGDNPPFMLTTSGIPVAGDNLISRTFDIISKVKKVPKMKAHLHKNIPMGAGLGGGSADA